MAIERRFVDSEFQIDDQGRIEGYGAVFDERSDKIGGQRGFYEFVKPGAFTKTLQEADVRSYFNHDPNRILGRSSAGTLETAEDSRGLHFRVTPPDASYARDLKISMERGDVNQASFGFDAIIDDWRMVGTDPHRDLMEVRLYDVGPVSLPAYPQTQVSIRSLAEKFIAQIGEDADPELVMFMQQQIEDLEATLEPPEEHSNVAPLEEVQVVHQRRRREIEMLRLSK